MDRRVSRALRLLVLGAAAWLDTTVAAALNLTGYADDSGAISVQREGATLDPYFALQALLLAHDSGLDARVPSVRWADWLAVRQKPDGTFDRFCRRGNVWAPCKTADADDALLAMWLRFLETMPQELVRRPLWRESHARARRALAALLDPARGIYLVSPVYQHGLFMDNLEVWHYKPAHRAASASGKPGLTRAIRDVFWDLEQERFLVSTQPEQRDQKHSFYPDAVAQIFPLWIGYPVPGANGRQWYKRWQEAHREEWLLQVETDFAWGMVAIVAW